MKILLTGSSGFVGGWLTAELDAHGHEVVGTPDPPVFDVSDPAAVRDTLASSGAAAVIHLAAVAYPPDAAGDAAAALRVNVGGTHAVLAACDSIGGRMPVLVVGSSEVYRDPTEGAALTETSPVAPRSVYGYTKLAAEALAIAAAGPRDLRIAVTRSFNHTGPGQRPVFVIPALAQRVLDARRTGVHEIRAGNVDVARDFSDVRDVARAYRLLLEALAADRVPATRPVFNVASGRAVTIRWVIETLARLADWPVTVLTDPSLVRTDDPAVIQGDATALRELTGWTAERPLHETLADVLASLQAPPVAPGR